ncbi:unnamed protein product [Ambrosiozyma monospora]|uniref:Unnamed protein product n=1 Tax=Ambrosiozyma monospora TaxID=43982 RepID=A0A9W6YYM0_AMBMO|nr:unnamed protein product [Ambrosiozyma monospora]
MLSMICIAAMATSFGHGDDALSVVENRELNYHRDNLRKLYHDYFVTSGVDLIISPTYNGVAPLGINHGAAGAYYWGYTTLWNILDLPTVVLPTGLALDPKIDIQKTDPPAPRSIIEKIEADKYLPELLVDAPIAVQLTGRRYSDEEVVAVSKVIDDIVNNLS